MNKSDEYAELIIMGAELQRLNAELEAAKNALTVLLGRNAPFDSDEVRQALERIQTADAKRWDMEAGYLGLCELQERK